MILLRHSYATRYTQMAAGFLNLYDLFAAIKILSKEEGS